MILATMVPIGLAVLIILAGGIALVLLAETL